MYKLFRLINLSLAAVLLSIVPANARLAQPPITVTPCVGRCACHDGSIAVYPANPTPNEEVLIVTSAPWSSSCPAVTCMQSRHGQHIYLDLTVVDMSTIAPVLCLTVISTWTMTNYSRNPTSRLIYSGSHHSRRILLELSALDHVRCEPTNRATDYVQAVSATSARSDKRINLRKRTELHTIDLVQTTWLTKNANLGTL